MKRNPHAQAAGAIPPTRDEGPTVAAVAPQESKQDKSPDSRGAPHAGQALRVIEGESYATAYLERLHAGTARPGELAVFLGFLRDDMLAGACRVIEKALGVQHG